MAKRVPVPSIALIGYTNAGKSTLFRALSGADAFVADQLFATLDPTVRRLRLPHTPDLVIADTVGFIRELPHELVAAFRSTLAEARDADLLLHVVDAADTDRERHIAQVDELIARSGGTSIRSACHNKIDASAGRRPPPRRRGQPVAVWLSAAMAQASNCCAMPCRRHRHGAMRLRSCCRRRRAGCVRALRTSLVREASAPGRETRLTVNSRTSARELCREAGVDLRRRCALLPPRDS